MFPGIPHQFADGPIFRTLLGRETGRRIIDSQAAYRIKTTVVTTLPPPGATPYEDPSYLPHGQVDASVHDVPQRRDGD
jgi:hypothetical protein